MAELALAIFGLAIPVAQGLFKLHAKLDEIAGAPNDITIFRGEMKLLGMAVKNFQKECPASVEKLARSKRQEALERAKALITHFKVIMKSIKAATAVILTTFDTNLGPLGQLLARIRWTFKKSTISEARDSMALFVGMFNMFTHSVMVEGLVYENELLRAEDGGSSRELRDKLNRLGHWLKEDRARVRGALKQGPVSSAASSVGLQGMEQTAVTMERKAQTVVGSRPRQSPRARQLRFDDRRSQTPQRSARAAPSEPRHRPSSSSRLPTREPAIWEGSRSWNMAHDMLSHHQSPDPFVFISAR